ncbi:MAG: GNAT family N-acetyltransferase [Bdellovibrionota bacterium]
MESLLIQAIETFTLIGQDGRKLVRPDLVQFVSPKISHGAMNTVVRARFSLNELDKRIDEALAPYNEAKLNCWWMLGPNSTNPLQTEERLSQLGFTLEHEAFGLALPTSHAIRTKISPKVSVEKVDLTNLDDFLRASRDGQVPSPSYRSYFEFIMEKQQNQLEVFLSRVDGEPAGTGILYHLGDAANFVSGFVRPKFRGLGAYQALVKFRLETLRERNIPYAVVLSKSKTSAPILMRNGFAKVCEMRTLELISKS